MRRICFLLPLAMVATAAPPARTEQVRVGSGSVVETVKQLKAGQYVWAANIAPAGPTLLIVNLKTQRAIIYRNGIPIGASTVSTGRPGYRTPTGVFTVLQKHVEHYSSKYDNAPMPYMQRLTWYGIALHAGSLPGYPASHGCIRLPLGFAKLLYGATKVGMTVVVTDTLTTPRLASRPSPLSSEGSSSGEYRWQSQKSKSGPVSIIVSAADRRAIVLRNGVEIGSASVSIEGPASGTWAYALRSNDSQGQQWIRVSLDDKSTEQPVPREEWQRFKAPEGFRRAVAAVVEPGTTVVVTSDSLQDSAIGTNVAVIDAEGSQSK